MISLSCHRGFGKIWITDLCLLVGYVYKGFLVIKLWWHWCCGGLETHILVVSIVPADLRKHVVCLMHEQHQWLQSEPLMHQFNRICWANLYLEGFTVQISHLQFTPLSCFFLQYQSCFTDYTDFSFTFCFYLKYFINISSKNAGSPPPHHQESFASLLFATDLEIRISRQLGTMSALGLCRWAQGGVRNSLQVFLNDLLLAGRAPLNFDVPKFSNSEFMSDSTELGGEGGWGSRSVHFYLCIFKLGHVTQLRLDGSSVRALLRSRRFICVCGNLPLVLRNSWSVCRKATYYISVFFWGLKGKQTLTEVFNVVMLDRGKGVNSHIKDKVAGSNLKSGYLFISFNHLTLDLISHLSIWDLMAEAEIKIFKIQVSFQNCWITLEHTRRLLSRHTVLLSAPELHGPNF